MDIFLFMGVPFIKDNLRSFGSKRLEEEEKEKNPGSLPLTVLSLLCCFTVQWFTGCHRLCMTFPRCPFFLLVGLAWCPYGPDCPWLSLMCLGSLLLSVMVTNLYPLSSTFISFHSLSTSFIIFNRHGVAGAVLQTAWSLTDSLICPVILFLAVLKTS